MKTTKAKLSTLNVWEDNPRSIDEYKYEALKTSITEAPWMQKYKPLIVDKNNRIVCGNMRFRAMLDLGYKECYVKKVDYPEAILMQIAIKDNISYGDWDWDVIEKEFNMDFVDKWLGRESFDYSALDYDDLNDEVSNLQGGVKKAIQIPILAEHYDDAKELEKKCREANIYIGGEFLADLQELANEKN